MKLPTAARTWIAVAAVALAASSSPAVSSAAPTGSITGTVTAAATHLPIPGVRVCAVSETEYEEVEEFCTRSGADGTYLIGGLPEARYAVEFVSSSEGLNYVYQAWKGQSVPFEANRVKVTTGQVSGIDAALFEGGMIGGLVSSYRSGAPIAGVEVCAEPESLEAVDVCATTDGAGRYTLLGLAAGGYAVEFWPPEQLEFLEQSFDGEVALLQADSVAVRTGQLTPNVNATLLEAGQIAGQVTDGDTHAPIAGVRACAFAVLGRQWLNACGESGADGRYLIRRVPAGTYTVRYSDESEPRRYGSSDYTGVCGKDSVAVTVAEGALTAGIDAGLFRPMSLGSGPPSCTLAAERPATKPPRKSPPKPKRCRKGTKRKLVRGKRRCVKVRKQHHRRGRAATR